MKNISNFCTALIAVAVLSLAGCGGSSPSELFVGELTEIRIGFTETSMDIEITDPGFYVLYTQGDEDTVCKLSDSSGNLIAEDDDSGQDYNCMINAVLTAGRYSVGVSGFEASDRGRVQIMIDALPVHQAQVGDVLNLDIAEGRGSVVALEVVRDGAYLLSTSGQLDTECRLFGADGAELNYNDDFGDDQNCGMTQRLSRGSYHFLISGYDVQSGRTTFMASPTEIETIALPLGEPRGSRLDGPESMVEFETEITEPGMYVFETRGDTDTYCELRNQSGELMAENDDGTDQNCRIRHALTAGSYWFNVQGYSGSTGEFTALAERR